MPVDMSKEPIDITISSGNYLTKAEIAKLKTIPMSRIKTKGTYETKRGLLIVQNGTVTGSGKIIGELGEPTYFNVTNEHTLKKAQEWRERRKKKWQTIM